MLLKALIKEQHELLLKLEKIRKEDNYGTYKNIVNALSEVTRLIEHSTPIDKWEQHYSSYKKKNDNGEWEETISTWEQKGEDIRNHKTYKVVDNNYVETSKIKDGVNNYSITINIDKDCKIPNIEDLSNTISNKINNYCR